MRVKLDVWFPMLLDETIWERFSKTYPWRLMVIDQDQHRKNVFGIGCFVATVDFDEKCVV